VQSVYGFAPPVIPRFVDLDRVGTGAPWHERPERALLVHGKKHVAELTRELRHRMASAHPDVEYELVPTERESHRAFLERLGRYRYFLTLSPAEGFGLPPLEAMASGCCVVGFHGNGGLEYMRPSVNCEVSGYPRLDAVADAVADLLRNQNRGEALARQGRIDAQGYGYPTAHARWIDYLSEVVSGTAPRGPGVSGR
jgi:glycosyltransferase involved in cell wall biosynthesis